jgi:putative ABC transport system permease protein
MTGRRAIVRWAVRMFRREWRQQILVLVLLSVVVAAAVFTATAAYNSPESPTAKFGTANTRVQLDRDAARPGHRDSSSGSGQSR